MTAVDTNVLIYACDQTDVHRQRLALDLITTTPDCVLLWQVASADPTGGIRGRGHTPRTELR